MMNCTGDERFRGVSHIPYFPKKERHVILHPMTSLRTNIRKLYAFSFLEMMLFPMAIITLFWKDRIGLTLTQILLLQSIFAVAVVVMEYPTGYISDRIGYRKALTIASFLGVLGWGIYSVASSFTHVLAAEILLGISLSFISGSDSALLYETLKAQGEEGLYSRHEGRMNGWGQIGEAVGALFAGLLYATMPLLPFFLQVGVWLLVLAVTRSLVEVPREPAVHGGHLKEALRSIRFTFLDNRRLRFTILLGVVMSIASFYPVWLIQPYMQHAGVPLTWFGPIWAGANLTVALFSLASHRVHARLGDRGMILLFVALIVGGYVGLGFTAGMWGFLFYFLLTAMRGLRGPMMLHHIQIMAPSGSRAGILSLQSLTFRLLFAGTGPALGMIADRSGVQGSFRVLCYAFLIALPPLSLLFLKSLQPKTGTT